MLTIKTNSASQIFLPTFRLPEKQTRKFGFPFPGVPVGFCRFASLPAATPGGPRPRGGPDPDSQRQEAGLCVRSVPGSLAFTPLRAQCEMQVGLRFVSPPPSLLGLRTRPVSRPLSPALLPMLGPDLDLQWVSSQHRLQLLPSGGGSRRRPTAWGNRKSSREGVFKAQQRGNGCVWLQRHRAQGRHVWHRPRRLTAPWPK